MEKEKTYQCEKCNFNCNTKARWEAHINTELHKTGIRKKRSDYKEPLKCELCDYETKNKIGLLKHKLNNHKTLEERKKEFKFYCVYCDFGTFSKDTYNIHTNTEKHKHFLSLSK